MCISLESSCFHIQHNTPWYRQFLKVRLFVTVVTMKQNAPLKESIKLSNIAMGMKWWRERSTHKPTKGLHLAEIPRTPNVDKETWDSEGGQAITTTLRAFLIAIIFFLSKISFTFFWYEHLCNLHYLLNFCFPEVGLT